MSSVRLYLDRHARVTRASTNGGGIVAVWPVAETGRVSPKPILPDEHGEVVVPERGVYEVVYELPEVEEARKRRR